MCHSSRICAGKKWTVNGKLRGRSESNASYFIMLAHDSRGGCWWHGSRGWTFPPIIFKFCCRATNTSRGAARHDSTYRADVCHSVTSCGKHCTCWHSWRPNSEAVVTVMWKTALDLFIGANQRG
jgi:hypothetical protein